MPFKDIAKELAVEAGKSLLGKAAKSLSSDHTELLCAGLNTAGLRNISHIIRTARKY